MSRIRKTLTALGLIAASLTLRCGDDVDDRKKDEEARRSAMITGAQAKDRAAPETELRRDGVA